MLRWYNAKVARRPLLTQAITTSILFAVGDITAQQAVEKRGTAQHDFSRTGRMALYGGAVFGPAATIWYSFLQRTVRLRRPIPTLAAQLACDQGMFAPIAVGAFLSSMAVLEGASPWDKVKQRYGDTLTANYMLWPAVQLVNFSVVPLAYRVLFVNVVSIGWNCYLSLISSSKKK